MEYDGGVKVLHLLEFLRDEVGFENLSNKRGAEVVALSCPLCYYSDKEGRLALDHVVDYNGKIEKAGIESDAVAPILLPDYSNPDVKKRQLTTQHLGTMR